MYMSGLTAECRVGRCVQMASRFVERGAVYHGLGRASNGARDPWLHFFLVLRVDWLVACLMGCVSALLGV
jgi:hypothetical protein